MGFDWPAAGPVWEKLAEETAELAEASRSGDAARVEEELGDLLFTVVNLTRFLAVDPGLCLNRSNEKFARRFRSIEQHLAERGIAPADAGLEAMDAVWNQLREEDRNASK